MYSAFKEFYNLLSQVNSVYHDAALKLGLTDSENPRSTLQYAGWSRPVICT